MTTLPTSTESALNAMDRMLNEMTDTTTAPAAPAPSGPVKPDFNSLIMQQIGAVANVPVSSAAPLDPVAQLPPPYNGPMPDDAWATWPTKVLGLRCGVRGGRGGESRTTLPEGPEPVMRYKSLLWQHGPQNSARDRDIELARAMGRMQQRARRAEKEHSHSVWREYYRRREATRSAGLDPDTVEPPSEAQLVALGLRDDRLLGEGPMDPSPFVGMHDDYSRKMLQRAEQEQKRYRLLLANEAREAKLDREAAIKESRVLAESAVRGGSCGTLTALQAKRRALAAAGRAKYLRPWTQRVLDDMGLVTRMGRPLPVARDHPLDSTPMIRRAHPAFLDMDLNERLRARLRERGGS